MRFYLFYICFFLAQTLCAQLKYNNNWYFGANAAMRFNTGAPTVLSDSKMKTYDGSASISDPETGILLFYTNGQSFWNRFGEMIDSSFTGNGASETLIIPLKDFKNRYLVVTFNLFTTIDMEANGGRGKIIKQEKFNLNSSANRMCAVKHCLSESYWLICVNGNSFLSYLVHPNGLIDNPVNSVVPAMKSVGYLGDFVSSNDGRKLSFTCYEPKAGSFYQTQVFNFDKRCGTVENTVTVLPMEADWDRPHGVAFSPDDALIYVAYGYQKSQLVQYKVNNPSSYYVVARSDENFNQIACGPDARLYITTHITGIPSNKIDVVFNPNGIGAVCNYKEDYLRLTGVTNFEVPNFIVNHTGTCAENKGFKLEADTGICIYTEAKFALKGDANGIDSLVWYFMDTATPGAKTKGWIAQHVYQSEGHLRPFAILYFCNKSDTFFFDLRVSVPVKINLGNDTMLCPTDSVRLGNLAYPGMHQWNTGSNQKTIWAKQKGQYILNIDNYGCISSDSIYVNYHPPLKTLLGDAYYICEELDELVLLDAGKGFKSYLWLPNNDTTQWIEVAKRGAYYVVVRDFRGCKGKGETDVSSRCDLRVFIPNAFTPNGDLLNDTYKVHIENEESATVQIYNKWGELIFSGDADSRWDGTYNGQLVEQDVYLVTVKVHGFINKRQTVKHYTSVLHVVY